MGFATRCTEMFNACRKIFVKGMNRINYILLHYFFTRKWINVLSIVYTIRSVSQFAHFEQIVLETTWDQKSIHINLHYVFWKLI